MQRELKTYIEDIITAIEKIENILLACQKKI